MSADRIWDFTALSAYVCPRHGYYKMERHLVPTGPPSAPLHAGSALHAGLDALYFDADIDAACDALADAWGDFEPSPLAKHSHLTLGFCDNVLRFYARFRFEERDEMYAPLRVEYGGGILGAETPIATRFEVDGDAVLYGGILDLPVRDRGGNLYLMDHKCTTAALTDFYFAQYIASNQLRGYAAVYEAELGEPVAGVIVNALHMGKNALSKRGDECFKRYRLPLSPGQVGEERRNIAARVAEIEMYRERGYWPQKAGWQCRGCDYAKLCAEPPVMREGLIERDYEMRIWDFRNRNGKGDNAED